MAEAAQRAGIEINLQIAGIEDLENVHNKVNSLVNDLPKLKESMNGLHMNLDFGEKAENQINELNTNLGRTNQILKEVHTDAQNIANPLRSDSEQAETLTSKFRTTKDTVNELTGNIKNAGNDTKQVGENARQIDEPFKQAVNILSEMSGDIKKVVDFQHQQTTAVKETNSSLRDVVGINEKIYSGQGRQTEAIKTTNVQIGQTRMAISEISHAQEGVTSDVKETESATSGWKDKLSGLKEKLNVKGTINEDNESAHRFGSTLESVQSKADATSHIFGKMLGANLISNGITNAFVSITSHINEAKEAVVEYNNKQQVMSATWDTLTGNAKKGQAMVDVGNQLSKAYGNSVEVVDELNQKFYHVFNNKEQTEQLTKSVLTLGDTLGMTNADVNRLGENFTHMMTSGKMQLGDFNHISDQLPMFGEKLLEQQKKVQHNSGLTMQQLQKQMSAGKVSAKDAEDVMNELGDKYQKASENLMKTMPGMTRAIKAQIPALMNDIYTPFAQMKNPLFEQVSKWVKDKNTEKEFSALGDNIKTQIQRITKAFDIKDMNITGGLDGIVKSMSNGVTNLGNAIIKNKGTLKDFFTVIKEGSSGSLKVFVEMLKIMEPLLKVTASAAAQHPKIFAAVAISMLAAGKAMRTFIVAIEGLKAIKDVIALMKEWQVATKVMTGIQIAFDAVLNANPIGIVVIGITALVAAIALAYAKIKPFRDFINGLGKMIVNVFKGVIDFFKNNWKEIGLLIINPFWGISAMLYKNVKPFRDFVNTVFGVIKSGFGAIGNFFGGFWNGVKNVFNTSLGFIAKSWSSSWNGMKNIVISIFGGISSFFGGVWNGIKSLFSSSLNFVTSLWTNSWNTVSNVGKSIWNGITSFLGGFWNGIKSVFNSSLNWVSNIWSNSWNGIFNFGKGIWNGIKNAISGLWDGIKNIWNSSIGFIVDKWKGAWDTITGVIKGAVSAVHHAMVDIARGVLKPINEMLKGLKDGINWVLDKVGADKISAKWEISMPGYAKGTGDTHPGGLAKVNDGATANFREMYQLPNGHVGMFPDKRNLIVNLPKGTSVLDGERSAMLAKTMNIPAYKDGIGGMISSVTDTVTGVFKGIWDKGADIVDMADDIIKKPGEFLETVFKKFVGIKDSKIGLANDVITKFPSTVAKEGMKWVKKLFEDAQENGGGAFGDAGGGRGDPSGSGVQRWRDTIKRALEANGASTDDSMINKWLRQIATESSGNPRAVQGAIGDINNKTGDLAKGLVQVIGSTFRANAFPGHTDIFNGYDNLLAGIHYAINRYGKGMGPIGNGHGYENGGFISQEQIAKIGEGNKLEAVVPLTKRNRAFEILRNIFSIMKPSKNEQDGLGLGDSNKNNSTMPGSDFYSPSTNTSSDHKDLNVGNSDKETLKELKKANKLNEQMFNAMLELADLSKEQIMAIKGSEPSIDNINKQQGLKFNIDNYQHP